MIRLNAKDDHVEVSITGSGGDIARELHALLDCIKNNESMQVAMMTASQQTQFPKKNTKKALDGMSEILKSVLRKGNNRENLKS